VACEPVETDPADPDTITNPRVVIEVLSESTEAFDRGDKFEAYRGVVSLADYVLISRHARRVEHFHREPDGAWTLREYRGRARVPIRSIAAELPIEELYAYIELGVATRRARRAMPAKKTKRR